ncbi:MAG: GNAT family N-acetyltransferase [bacterium]|nr:GNAT family N-acetyltransferase [bacterium]
MSLQWIHEQAPTWDETKQSIVGGAAEGIFDLSKYSVGEMVPCEWWRVERDGHVLGYGWLDSVFGDAEVLLAVDSDGRKQGVGTFILDRLEEEASARGLNYMFNIVRPTHPDPAGVSAWLKQRGFEAGHDDQTLRRAVHHK